MRTHKGVTLIELMIAIALLATIFSLAVPSFSRAMVRTQLGSAESTLFASVNDAMNSSFLRNQRLVMCPSNGADTCTAGHEWSKGWIVFDDRDENREHSADEALIHRHSGLDNGLRLFSSSGRTRLIFQSGGANFGSNAHFKLCHPDHLTLSRSLYLANNGRLRVSATPNIPCSP
jgi:type IV fimbrial biogenesis protein FimT